jgi:hypothetical protein
MNAALEDMQSIEPTKMFPAAACQPEPLRKPIAKKPDSKLTAAVQT